jgi:hypothetical protein
MHILNNLVNPVSNSRRHLAILGILALLCLKRLGVRRHD